MYILSCSFDILYDKQVRYDRHKRKNGDTCITIDHKINPTRVIGLKNQ